MVVKSGEHRNTEQAIMDAAEDVFLEKGYLLATTVKIAEKAGVTHAMLHYYYRTKEQIFIRVLDKNFAELFESMRSVMTLDAPFWEIMEGGITLFFDFLSGHRKLVILLYDVARQNPQLLAKYRAGMMNILMKISESHKEKFREETVSGNIRKVSYEDLFFEIMFMLFSTFLVVPVLQNVLMMDENGIEDFLKKRKGEIIMSVRHMLYGEEAG